MAQNDSQPWQHGTSSRATRGGVPEVGFRITPTSKQPNHGAIRSQSPQERPPARRMARRWSRVIGAHNARWRMGAGARTAHRTSTGRHRFQSALHVDNSSRSVASKEAGKGVFESAPWKRVSRGGAAEGTKLPMYAIFFMGPPIPPHMPLP